MPLPSPAEDPLLEEPYLPFTTSQPSKRTPLRLQRLVDKNETITGFPARVPFTRLGKTTRTVLGEAASIHYNQQLGFRSEAQDIKGYSKTIVESPSAANIAIWEDREVVELEEAPLPQLETDGKENNPPTVRASKKRTVKISEQLDNATPSSSHPVSSQQDSPPALPQPTASAFEPPLPSSLSNLLMNHSSPRIQLPSIPTPPLSRLHRRFETRPSSAAPPPTPIPTPSENPLSESEPSPLEQMRALRAEFHNKPLSSPPVHQHRSPRRRRSPPPPRESIASRHAFSLQNLPAMTHHSRAAIIHLYPPTHLELTLREHSVGGSRFHYRISADAGPVTVLDSSDGIETTYNLEDLPWRHLRAYKYARKFAAAVAKRTVVSYGGIEGARGRVWADGRGLIQLDKIEVELHMEPGKAYGMAMISGRKYSVTLFVDDEGERILPTKPNLPTSTQESIDLAGRLYLWLLSHPSPVEQTPDEEDSLKLDAHSVFVKDVGWCRRDADGRWEMVFLDGVRLEIDAGNGDVIWTELGRKRLIKAGMKERAVRERVKGFVNAGL